MSCNNILNHSSDLCDLVQLPLHESYVLPTLTYVTAAIKVSETQIAVWMHVGTLYIGVFDFNRGESVKCFSRGLGRLDFRYLRLQLSTKLYLSMQLCKNSVVREVFKTFMFSKEFIQFCILSKWSNKTTFSNGLTRLHSLHLQVLCITCSMFVTVWYNFVFCKVCSICSLLLLYFAVVLPTDVINVLITVHCSIVQCITMQCTAGHC